MKLLARTNLYYIFFSILTYFIVAVSFYLVIEYMIYQEVDERLIVESRDFQQYIRQHGYWEESCYFVEDKITVSRLTGRKEPAPVFKDTLLQNRYTYEVVPFREYTFSSFIGTDLYKVSIRKSLIESNQLLKIITVVMLILLSIGLSLLFLFQRRISKHIWQPFYNTLSKAKSFNVHEGKGLMLDDESIFEFRELNASLEKMTDKIASDYRNLKEFTENASHEIQTPLALINSRVEGLIQLREISGRYMRWIQDIHESAMRLSKLNQALLLLTKIENGQFHETERIDINQVLKHKIQELEELFNIKEITIDYQAADTLFLKMHAGLADVLVTNLVSNAIKHNVRGGKIIITVNDREFTISNTGNRLTVDPELLFERFKKQNNESGSLGLGLSIVKKICDVFGLKVHYTFDNGLHTITISKR